MRGEYGFPRHERLTRKRDYLRVYQEGSRRVGREFVCYATRREGEGRRIGITVSRKVGSAVVRNRVKRYLREAYRTQRPELCEGFEVVLVARPYSAGLNYAQCRRAVRCLLQQEGLLRG